MLQEPLCRLTWLAMAGENCLAMTLPCITSAFGQATYFLSFLPQPPARRNLDMQPFYTLSVSMNGWEPKHIFQDGGARQIQTMEMIQTKRLLRVIFKKMKWLMWTKGREKS